MKKKMICKAMHRIHSRRYRFVYDAYFYCERRPKMRDVILTLQELEHEDEIADEILNEYALDVLAGRCEPMTQEFIVTPNGKEIV